MTRIAVIDKNMCIKEKCGYICKEVCPVNRMRKVCVDIADDAYPTIDEVLCIGCGICVKKCPVLAISVINLKEEVGLLTFQYGKNSFRLYNLPLPRKGVVGLIGKNGIGKSTAIRLLIGELKINFGQFEKDWKEEDILARLHIEARPYYERVFKGKKLSYKPQNVALLKDVKIKVKTLLKKFDERNILSLVVDQFNFGSILEKTTDILSGGELQKLAIACAYMRKTDVYCFDEPTNYLDIAERMSVALLLKKLGEQQRVIVVDHDLAVFDYLSEYVHVFFGEEGAYGVVSGLKGVGTGINSYLKGFLKEENIRFRENELIFESGEEEEGIGRLKLKYPSLSKTYPGFAFTAEEGEIREGEVIGLVGRNALGKTLFISTLAENCLAESVSYKPQYLKPEDILTKDFVCPLNKEVSRVFNMERLIDRNMKELSFGELQKVYVARALSTKAELYLLDEPTAFLDIEERMKLASLIRKMIIGSKHAAFIVDHDVVFLDAVSSRIIVFEGESSKRGIACRPMNKMEGLNLFLKNLGITMRRDKETLRPKINKPGSVLDREQRKSGDYFYSERIKKRK